MKKTFFGLHTDFHAKPEFGEIFNDLTVEKLVRQLESLNPDYVQCDCKGHRGYASYFSDLGCTCPTLKKDNVKIWREAANILNIPLYVHFSGIWDELAAKKHPDWCVININGGRTGCMCTLSPYADEYMIPQMLEIIDKYNVDGFWIDGDNWAVEPCYCDRCITLFKEQTGKKAPETQREEAWQEWLDFHRENFKKYVKKYSKKIKEKKPDCKVCSNWMYTMRQPEKKGEEIDYISGDFDYVWSVKRALIESKLMANQDTQWNLMQWSFITYPSAKDWCWTLKSVPAMCREAGVTMSMGGGVLIYDQPMKNGVLLDENIEKFRTVERFVRAREEYCINTETLPQAAILHAKENLYIRSGACFQFGNAINSIEGAVYLLNENGYSVDILTSDNFRKKIFAYPILIIPEQANLSAEIVSTVEEYVKRGGFVVISGQNETKAFKQHLGIEYDEGCFDCANRNSFMKFREATVPAAGKWSKVKAINAQTIKYILCEKGYYYENNQTEYSAITINRYGAGKFVGIYGPVFSMYNETHFPQYRDILREVLQRCEDERIINISAPAYVFPAIRKRENKIFINFVNISSDFPLSARNNFVENISPSGSVAVRMKLSKRARSIYLAPSVNPVDYMYDENFVTIKIPQIYIHDILVIEL